MHVRPCCATRPARDSNRLRRPAGSGPPDPRVARRPAYGVSSAPLRPAPGGAPGSAEVRTVEETVEQRGPGAGAVRLPDATVARLVRGWRDPTVRDRAMGLALGATAAAAEALWAELTRRAPSPLDAVPATLLAVGCWARGDGAMANVALDRAQQSEPSGSLARLMRSALDQALPPADLRAMIEATLGQLGDRRSAC